MAEREVDFRASASALGYVYQLREALYLCVSRLGLMDWSLAIEAGDDIELVHEDGRTYYQLKHRAQGTRLTDASVDLWKTLRIWCLAVAQDQIALDETDLILITTASVPTGSVGSVLQPPEVAPRDETGALRALKAVRATSTNTDLAKAFAAFDLLSDAQLEYMVSRIQVVAGAPDVKDVEHKLLQSAVTAVGREHATSFLMHLEGWFYQRTIVHLLDESVDAITALEFDGAFSDLRHQFARTTLPIDEDVALMEADLAKYAREPFVRQLELIQLGSTRVNRAVRDYMRAFEQRSRWLRDQLVLPQEISRYERRLIEEWDDLFLDMADTLGPDAAEAQKVEAAKGVYRWAMAEAKRRIRPECDEPFVTKGSFHMLADELRVGWHVDFTARLVALLEPAGSTTE
ncbi:ABC-three component system protein [Streptomyces sp. NPDC057694]|uniref:ABC-three component system protein n=1 Tax=Streptomyces sp. NPDC057694 TaxID=3346216 RepID=UPI0036AF7BF2